MSDDPIRALERISRHIDRAMQALAASQLPERKDMMSELGAVLEQIRHLRKPLIAACPDADYHHDKSIPPTPYMQRLFDLHTESEMALDDGNALLAVAILNEALGLDPPPIVYEMIERKRDEILAGARE